METLKWLREHSLKSAKILGICLIAVVIVTALLPKGYMDIIINKLAFAEIVLPTPKTVTPATMKLVPFEDDTLHRSGFSALVQTISLRPNDMVQENMTVYGYARTDLFEKEKGTMWFVIRRADGAPVATGQAYTQYYTAGFGFVPFSLRVPYLLVGGPCLLEFRKQDPSMTKLSDILFTSMPVTCVASKGVLDTR